VITVDNGGKGQRMRTTLITPKMAIILDIIWWKYIKVIK
jgi:hypothetical protein